MDDEFPELSLPEELPVAEWTNVGVQTETATIYLLRWESVDESVDFNVTIKDAFVRGPARDPMR